MDPKYFIFILFCGHLNCVFSIEATTEQQPSSALFRSSLPPVSEGSHITTGNPLSQQTQPNSVSSGPPILTNVSTEKQRPAIYASSEKLTAYTSAVQTVVLNITRQPTTRANTSFQQTSSTLSSARPLPSTTAFTGQSPPFVYTSQPQTLSVHTSGKSPATHNLSTQSTPTVKKSPRVTPGFILNNNNNENYPHKTNKTNSNSIAAILIGIILTIMLLAIILIVLWKYLRKPVVNDQNWAGRSPFADGETPDICMDNIRENDTTTKRTSIVSLMAWKASKHTLLADDLEIKLFESSENNEDSRNPKVEKLKDEANGTSEDSADGSTIGTAVSSSDDADLFLPPPPPVNEVGQERNQSDTPTMPFTSPLPNDSGNHASTLACSNQVCEGNSDLKQSFPPPPDEPNLPLPENFTANQDDSNNMMQSQCLEFSIPLDSDEGLDESLPPPPAELL